MTARFPCDVCRSVHWMPACAERQIRPHKTSLTGGPRRLLVPIRPVADQAVGQGATDSDFARSVGTQQGQALFPNPSGVDSQACSPPRCTSSTLTSSWATVLVLRPLVDLALESTDDQGNLSVLREISPRYSFSNASCPQNANTLRYRAGFLGTSVV